MMGFELFKVLGRGVTRECKVIDFFKSIENTDKITIEVNEKKMEFRKSEIWEIIDGFIEKSEESLEKLKSEMIESGYIKSDD